MLRHLLRAGISARFRFVFLSAATVQAIAFSTGCPGELIQARVAALNRFSLVQFKALEATHPRQDFAFSGVTVARTLAGWMLLDSSRREDSLSFLEEARQITWESWVIGHRELVESNPLRDSHFCSYQALWTNGVRDIPESSWRTEVCRTFGSSCFVNATTPGELAGQISAWFQEFGNSTLSPGETDLARRALISTSTDSVDLRVPSRTGIRNDAQHILYDGAFKSYSDAEMKAVRLSLEEERGADLIVAQFVDVAAYQQWVKHITDDTASFSFAEWLERFSDRVGNVQLPEIDITFHDGDLTQTLTGRLPDRERHRYLYESRFRLKGSAQYPRPSTPSERRAWQMRFEAPVVFFLVDRSTNLILSQGRLIFDPSRAQKYNQALAATPAPQDSDDTDWFDAKSSESALYAAFATLHMRGGERKKYRR